MKKLFILALAFAFALCFAGSAFAFTGITTPDAASNTQPKYTVSIQLVDYNLGWKDGIYYKVAQNRTYVINEMVGALVTVTAPAHAPSGVATVEVSGSNMKLMEGLSESDTNMTLASGKLTMEIGDHSASTSAKTYKFFIKAQLTSEDGGSLTAKVIDGDDATSGLTAADGLNVAGASGELYNVTLSNLTYKILATVDGNAIEAGDYLEIVVNKSYLCKSMFLTTASGTYELATVNGKIAFKSGSTYIVAGDADYAGLYDKYNEFCNEFGFSFAKSGYLYQSYFVGDSFTTSATVKVQPALPSSALKPDSNVKIPQTGSVSLMGFAMIALCALASVAAKKARG